MHLRAKQQVKDDSPGIAQGWPVGQRCQPSRQPAAAHPFIKHPSIPTPAHTARDCRSPSPRGRWLRSTSPGGDGTACAGSCTPSPQWGLLVTHVNVRGWLGRGQGEREGKVGGWVGERRLRRWGRKRAALWGHNIWPARPAPLLWYPLAVVGSAAPAQHYSL